MLDDQDSLTASSVEATIGLLSQIESEENKLKVEISMLYIAVSSFLMQG